MIKTTTDQENPAARATSVRAARVPSLPSWVPSARKWMTHDPDAAHGFLFQHHAEFAADVVAFLGEVG
jgi:hypothetical protein